MVKKLDYNSGLSLDEAQQRYTEIAQEFQAVKGHYESLFRNENFLNRLRRRMSKDDKKTLSDCIGVLLPLSHEASVQQEVVGEEPTKDALFYKLQRLEQDILTYASRFRNTGIKSF